MEAEPVLFKLSIVNVALHLRSESFTSRSLKLISLRATDNPWNPLMSPSLHKDSRSSESGFTDTIHRNINLHVFSLL